MAQQPNPAHGPLLHCHCVKEQVVQQNLGREQLQVSHTRRHQLQQQLSPSPETHLYLQTFSALKQSLPAGLLPLGALASLAKRPQAKLVGSKGGQGLFSAPLCSSRGWASPCFPRAAGHPPHSALCLHDTGRCPGSGWDKVPLAGVRTRLDTTPGSFPSRLKSYDPPLCAQARPPRCPATSHCL